MIHTVALLLYGAVAGILCTNVFFSDEPLTARALIFVVAWTWPISLPIVFARDWIVDHLERRRLLKMRGKLH